ncbi:MAG: HIT family protein [Burkholderiaceae bacterium]|nr:HIT family protein [Burkholderiaceae bacterium]
MSCPLCDTDGGRLLFSDRHLRVIAVDDPDYPGFTRVIWHDHVAEMTDFAPVDRDRIMAAVYTIERVLRDTLAPDKVNLAAFGTMVPHLHWHIIPRWAGDRHYPDAYWSAARVSPGQESPQWHRALAERAARVAAFERALSTALSTAATIAP